MIKWKFMSRKAQIGMICSAVLLLACPAASTYAQEETVDASQPAVTADAADTQPDHTPEGDVSADGELDGNQSAAEVKAEAEEIAKAEEGAEANAEEIAKAEAAVKAKEEEIAKAEAAAQARAEEIAKAKAKAKEEAQWRKPPVSGKDGWNWHHGGWYYFRNGRPVSGWLQLGDTWYFMDEANAEYPYRMVSSSGRQINGKWYDFSSSGAMQRGWGWSDEAGGWYYHADLGNRRTGWLKDGGTWYYLDPANNGLMASNKDLKVSGSWYSFARSGAMRTGWIWTSEKGGWYYHAGWGGRTYGWLKNGGTWYYLDPADNGLMASNKDLKVSGSWYSFARSGAMRTGWVWTNESGGGWYYHAGWGGRSYGWANVGGTWYFLDSSKNGLMVHGGRHSVWGRTFWFTSSGAMRTGWIWEDGNWYYAGSDGAMKTGWQNTSSGRYYLYKYNDPNGGTPGAMAHDVTIDGIKIPSNGSASVAYGKAGKKLDQIGWDLKAAFRWSASMPYVNVSNSPSPGSEYFANYGFNNGRGDCYVMAATFYYMAKALGYDAHQMAGYVPLLNGGRGVHSWVEIDVNGGTYVFDPDFAHETGGSGYWFTYGTSGTWRYMDGYRMN